jgi:hypothetical protein
VIGYAIIARQEQKNNTELDVALSRDEFSGSEAITLRIPLAMPYPADQNNAYERIEGTFNHEGDVYRLVRRKHFNDTLYVVCVKDKKGTIIAAKMKALTASFAGKSLPEKSNPKISNLLAHDFQLEPSTTHKCPRILLETLKHSNIQFAFESNYGSSIDQPPQA